MVIAVEPKIVKLNYYRGSKKGALMKKTFEKWNKNNKKYKILAYKGILQ